ncbi:MAG: glycosyltransferase [Burkholderiales bacterium]|nr:glycosyltransferase [Opitutaceae bacterium]
MRRIVILEPDLDGHHAFWLALLIEAHRQAGWGVEVVTSKDDSRLRAQAALRGFELSDVRIHAAVGTSDGELLKHARALAKRVDADRVFVAFLDRFWPALLEQSRDWSETAKIAGIWFHPHALDAKWRFAPPVGKRWKVRGELHRFIRSSAAARVLASLYFTVDEPVGKLARSNPALRGVLLPDPYEREPRLDRDAARRLLGVPAGRTVFLHLGSPERRKGLPDVLAAFERLGAGASPGSPAAPLLLRVGANNRLNRSERDRLAGLVSAGRAMAVEKFVPVDELMEYFAASDWVLIPYRKFRYSSGILANAIGAGRPVIATDHGHIGREVARAGFGFTYRHGSVPDLTRTLVRALEADAVTLGRAAGEKEARTADAFVAAVRESLL